MSGAAGESGGPPTGGGRLLGGGLHGPGQDHPRCGRGQGDVPCQGDREAHHRRLDGQGAGAAPAVSQCRLCSGTVGMPGVPDGAPGGGGQGGGGQEEGGSGTGGEAEEGGGGILCSPCQAQGEVDLQIGSHH